MKKFLKILILPLLITASFFTGCESNDSPVSSVYIPQPVNRKTLFEFFSNQACTPCIEPHRSFLEPLEVAAGITINDTSVILLAFQYKYPGIGDSIYRANVIQNDARASYYSVQAAPAGFTDGMHMGNYSFSQWSDQLSNAMNSVKYLDISISNVFNAGIDSGVVTAHVQTLVQPPTNDNVIHIIVTENHVPYVTAQNGITRYDGVMRYMETGSNGTPISLGMGQTVNFTIPYGIRSTWKTDDCYIIAFIQSTSTKQVYGVEKIKIN
jgi:hypothetical protein